MEKAIAHLAAECPCAAPVAVGCDRDLAQRVRFGVVHVQPQRLAQGLLHRLAKRGLVVQERLGGRNHKVAVGLETGTSRGRVGLDFLLTKTKHGF